MILQGTHYDIDGSIYHADPCPEPSLSASIAKIIWQESPAHAREHHPRLNLDFVPVNKRQFDLGAAAHAVLLEGDESNLVIVEADNYRTKAAQETRDAAYDSGLIPLFESNLTDVREMARIAKNFIEETELAGIFEVGNSEVTLVEFSDGFGKRCRLDWLTNDRFIILDYKTTGGSSKPETWIRRMLFPLHYDIQAYLYLYLNGLTGGVKEAKFIWLVQENEKPYACSLVGASPSVIESGKKKFKYAVHKWKYCIEHDKWPAHDSRIHWAESPSWNMAEVEERGNCEK